jgi:hypothetical protein
VYLFIFAAVLIVVGAIAGLAGAGIFTLILIPIGVVVGVGAFVAGLAGRSEEATTGTEGVEPLPHSPPASTGRVPDSPEALADARRGQQ